MSRNLLLAGGTYGTRGEFLSVCRSVGALEEHAQTRVQRLNVAARTSILAAAKSLRRQFVEPLAKVRGELAHVPEPPAIGDVGHFRLCGICGAQLTPDGVQSVSHQKRLGGHAEAFDECVFESALADL